MCASDTVLIVGNYGVTRAMRRDGEGAGLGIKSTIMTPLIINLSNSISHTNTKDHPSQFSFGVPLMPLRVDGVNGNNEAKVMMRGERLGFIYFGQ